MSQSEQIRTALAAADSAIWLRAPEQVAQAAQTWRKRAMLALDTEFVRERTYHANIGLVQVSDGQTVWLLDPLVRGNIEPLARLLDNRKITKIVHSPSEDFEVLLHATGALPDPVFDTQVACAMLGQPLQTGYHTAVEWLLGVQIDKDQTRSNWCARPLRPVQLRYAALDVCLLPLLWQTLEGRLVKKGRMDWFLEDCRRQLEQAREPPDPDAAWRRIRGIGKLDGASLAILQKIADWRDTEARHKNRPRGFIVPDPVLLAIAGRKITDPVELEAEEGFHPRARQRYGQAITGMVAETLESGLELPRIKSLTFREHKLLKRMRARVLRTAEALEIEAALLAPKRDVEDLIRSNGEVPRRLSGWRAEVITNELLRILEDKES